MTHAEIVALIRAEAVSAGVDAGIMVRQCGAESSFNPEAVSPCGCKGLFQLSDATAGEFGCANPFDPAQNIRAAARYMAWLLRHYGGDYSRALAGYNWGVGHLDKLTHGHPEDWREHLPAETAAYLRKILP